MYALDMASGKLARQRRSFERMLLFIVSLGSWAQLAENDILMPLPKSIRGLWSRTCLFSMLVM